MKPTASWGTKMDYGLENTNRIYHLTFIQETLRDLERLETLRIFCKHDLEHFMDVARILYIKILEGNYPISKDVAYSAALLHDLGRLAQYNEGIPHEEASLTLAKRALAETSYSEKEVELILSAIAGHRKVQTGEDFASLFAQADKLARLCFNCPAQGPCNWSYEKKNHELKY